MTSIWKRSLSMFLAIVMVIGMLPMNVLAEELTGEPEAQTEPTDHVHDYVGAVTTEATCTAEGVMTYTCECGEGSYTEVIPAQGHSNATVAETPATCTEDGVAMLVCSACGAETTEVIPATGHSYSREVTLDPTCTEAGAAVDTCGTCGDVVDVVLEATGHANETVGTVDPTCTEAGSVTYKCTVCDAETSETIAATGHSFANGACTTCGAEDPVAVVQGMINALPTTISNEEQRQAAVDAMAAIDDLAYGDYIPNDRFGELSWENYGACEDAIAAYDEQDYSKETLEEYPAYYWNSDKTVLYIKNGSISKADLYSAFVEKDGTDNGALSGGGSGWLDPKWTGCYKYATSSPTANSWIGQGTELKKTDSGSISNITEGTMYFGHKTGYTTSWSGVRSFAIKAYYIPTVTVDANTLGVSYNSVTPTKVVHGGSVSFNLTAANAAGWTAVYPGGSKTLSTTAATPITVENITSADAANISVTLKEATSYGITVNVNKDTPWGTASADVSSSIAGETITITATPNAALTANDYTYATHAYSHITVNGVDQTGLTFTMPEGTVDVEVHFTQEKLESTANDTVAWNGYLSDGTQLTSEQMIALKTEILTSLGVKYNGNDLSVSDEVNFEYRAWMKGNQSGDMNQFADRQYALNGEAENPNFIGIGYTGKNFGELAYNNGAALKTGAANTTETVIITYKGLTILKNITLTEAREVYTVQYTDPTVEFDDQEDIDTAVQNALTAANPGKTITSEIAAGQTLPGGGQTATLTYNVTVADDAADLGSTNQTVTITATAKANPANIAFETAGTGSGTVNFGGLTANGTLVAGTYTLTVTPNDLDGTDASAMYVESVEVNGTALTGSYNGGVYTASYTVANNASYTIKVTYGTATLTNQKGTLELNGYENKKFDNLKNNIITATLGGGTSTEYNVYVWIDPHAGDPRYFNLDDNSLLGDWNALTVVNADRFNVPAYGATGSLKVKLVKAASSDGKIVALTLNDATIPTKEAREPAQVSFGSAASGKYDTLDLFKEAVAGTINVLDNNNADCKANAGLTVTLNSVEGKANTYTVSYSLANDGETWLKTSGTLEGEVVWTISAYKVTFRNDDQSLLSEKEYDYGTTADKITVPTATKADKVDVNGNVMATYTFAGWDPAVDTVTQTVTYTATYTEVAKTYTITWVNGNETTTETYEYGETPVAPTASKNSTAQYHYTNGTWGEIATVTGDATYTATFTEELRSYTITWVNGDETTTTTVAYGETPVAPAATKSDDKAANGNTTYYYTNGQWPTIATVTGDATYTATFTKNAKEYTLIWNVDGDETTETVAYGTEITLDNAPSTDKEGHTFASWTGYTDGMTMPAEDTTLTATWTVNTYNYKVETYTMDIEGNYGKADVKTFENIAYGTKVTAAHEAKTGFEVADTSVLEGTIPANNDLVLKVYYSRNQYTITYLDTDGSKLKDVETYYYDAPVTAYAPSREGYGFGGWKDNASVPTTMPAENLTLTVSAWNANEYTITWNIDGVETYSTEQYDATVTLPADPDKYGYDFAGWDVNGTVYTSGWTMGGENVTATAKWTKCVADVNGEDYITWQAAYDAAVTGNTIVLLDTIPLTSKFYIAKDITVDGQGEYGFVANNASWNTSGSNYHLIGVNCDGITLQNITLDCNNQACGVNIYQVENITFDNVTILNASTKKWNAALTVNGSALTVNNGLKVTGGFGSIEVDKTGASMVANGELDVTGAVTLKTGYPTNNFDNATKPDGTAFFSVKTVNAQGETTRYYNTLERISTGYTRILLNDYTQTSDFEIIKTGNSGTLDLNGKTLTIAAGKKITVNGVLTIENPGAIQGTMVLGTEDAKIIAPAGLTIESGVEGYFCVYENGVYRLETSYTITFVDEDGTTELQSSTLNYGETPEYTGETPTKAATAQYTYTFNGWNPAIDKVTGTATYTATYSATVNTYTVTWVNGDEQTTETYEYGATPVAPTAIKSDLVDGAGNVMATYTNGQWPTVETVTGDATYTATFTEVPAEYTVTWNVDGKTTTETYKYGDTPVFTGSTDKATVNSVQYTFTGWDPAIAGVTGNATYTAQYSSELLASNGEFTMNGYYEARGNMDEIIKTLKSDVLNAAGLNGANASNYTVTMKYSLGTLDLDKLSGWSNALNATAFFTAIELPESARQFTITDKATGVSKTVTMKIEDSRSSAGLEDLVITETVTIDENNTLAGYVEGLIADARLNTNSISKEKLTWKMDDEKAWPPAKAGVPVNLTYTVSYADDATYIGDSAKLTVSVQSAFNNCTVVLDSTDTTGSTLTVSPSNDGKTVAGNDLITVTVNPADKKAVKSITISKNGTEAVTISTITYSDRKATVTFTSDGSVNEDVYTVTVEYEDIYLNLKADQTIVYCVDDKDHTYDLQKLVFDAIYGGSSAPMTKDNVKLEFKYGHVVVDLWADVSKDPAINLNGISHKFGESGSETIKLTYSDAKYGSFEQQIALNVFDSCYDVTVGVETVTNGANATIKTQYSQDARKYLGVNYFKKDTSLTVTLTPDGAFLDTLKQMYNGTYADAMAYIKSVTVYDKAGNVVPATLTRDQGKLSLEGILQGVNPMLYNAAVTFNLASEEAYKIVVEYGILELDCKNSGFQMEMYKGGKDYAAKVPSAQELVNATMGESEAAAFLATYGGAYTVEFTNALLQNEWTAVSDEALLALNDGSEITVRITWKPTDGDKTYYPVADTAKITLVDLRTPTSVAGTVPAEKVAYVDETKLIAALKEAMGLGITAEGAAIDVDYTVTYTITVDETNGNSADVTVTYDGAAETAEFDGYKPTSKTFENVPIADIPDNATIKINIQNASDVVTNNDGKIMPLDPATGIYTVIGKGTYNFKFTPVSGKAIESVTVNGEKLDAVVAAGKATQLFYKDGVATFTLYLEEKVHYEIDVETIDSVWVLEDERVYDFAYGVMDPVNKDIVDAAAKAPTAEAIDYSSVEVEYKARTEGKVTVTLPNIDLGFTIIELGTFDVDLGELWLNPEEKVEMVNEDQLDKILENLVDDVITKVSSGELAATNAFTYIQDYIKNLPLGIHAFGEAGDGSTETIRIRYADDKYILAEVETDVTIHDYRTPTEIAANDCEVTFGYSLAQLIEAAGAAVTADGAAVEGLAIQTNDLYKHAKAEAQEVTLYFAGDANYQPSEVTINVTVNKAPASIDYDSQTVIYGTPYDLALSVSPTVMPDGTTAQIDRIEMMIGLDMHKLLDVDIEDKTVGINEAVAYIQLRLPQAIRELPLVGQYLQGEFTLGEFTELINSLSDSLGIDPESMGILNQVVEAITGVTNNMEIKVIIKDEDFHPTNIGLYIAGAVTVDSDFETAYTADYLIIAPKTIEAELEWDYQDKNGIMTLPVYQELYKDLMGAHVVENEVMTGDVLAKANDHVKYLLLGVSDETSEFLTTDIYGNIKANIWALGSEEGLADVITDNGAYVQIAYMLNWGNEIYYAMPIVRSFVVVPQTVTVNLVGSNGDHNRDLLKTFNNEPQGFNVKVYNAAEELIYSDHYQSTVTTLPEGAELTYSYIGVQTNGKSYNDIVAPTHAGAYAVVATYIQKDKDDNLLCVGADAGVLVIEPSKSSITVDDAVKVYDPDTSYSLKDLVTDVDSLNSDVKPDTTIISGLLSTDGTFSENGLSAITGSVNFDFPKWVDALIAEHAPSVKNGITVAELKDKLLNKLPDFSAELEAAGATAEVINSLSNLTGTLTDVLDKLPDDMTLTFNDDVQVKQVGAYLVMGIVTDSDHYPSTDTGILVITPDATLVELKYDEDPNGNNVFTPEALKYIDLGAKAYKPGTTTEVEEATAIVVNIFTGVNAKGEAVVTDDPTTLDNGVYTEFSYILDVDSQMYYAEPISRVIVLAANPAEVYFVRNGVENNDQLYTFDNTPKAMDVEIKVGGNVVTPDEGDVTVTYVGMQTNGKKYNDTVAPTHAGVYVATATYADYDENGKLVSFGAAVGALAIEPAESTIAVTGGKVPYDGNGHTATVEVTGANVKPDYTLISGGATVSGDMSEVDVDAFHGNVNIDFPKWLDAVLAENEFFKEGVDAAYLTDFITSYRDDLVAAIPVDALVALGVEEATINGYIEKMNDYIDKLLAVLAELPEDVNLTFTDNVTYTEPGYYAYYGIVTDSDHYPSTETGLLVIEKADIHFDLIDTTYTWDGTGKMVEIENPKNADFISIIIDRVGNTCNIVLDEDAQLVLNKVAEMLGVEFDGDVQMSTIKNNYNGEEIAAALVKAISAIEQLEVDTEIAKALAAVKAELESLPEDATITVNGALPSEIGEYEVYALSYSEYYKTVTSEAVLEIVPVQVEVVLKNDEKVYGTDDPEEFPYEINFYDYNDEPIEGDESVVTVTTDREEGEDVGTYAISATVELKDEKHYTLIAQPEDAVFEITPVKLVLDVNDAEKIYGEDDPEFTYEIVEGALVGEDTLNVSWTREPGKDVGSYAITLTESNNPNYSIEIINDASLTIKPAQITVAIEDASKVYGEDDPESFAHKVTVTAGKVTDAELGLTVQREPGNDVGKYKITANWIESGNYEVTVDPEGTFTITPAELTIKVKDATITYGDAYVPYTENYATGLYQDTIAITSKLTGTYTDAGSYADVITVDYADNKNYTITVDNGDLTIERKQIKLVADNASKVYGEQDPAFTYVVCDMAGNKLDITLDAAVMRYNSANDVNVGTYTGVLRFMATTNPNYDVEEYVSGNFEIKPAAFTVTLDDESITYGETWQSKTYDVETGIYSDKLNVTTKLTGDYTAAGTYTDAIDATVVENKNYTITVEKADLTINKAVITSVTVDPNEVTYNGQTQTANLVVMAGNLKLDTADYDVTGNTGKDAATYTVTVTGKGNFEGEATATWTIKPIEVIVNVESSEKEYGAPPQIVINTNFNEVKVDGAMMAPGFAVDGVTDPAFLKLNVGEHILTSDAKIMIDGNVSNNYNVTVTYYGFDGTVLNDGAILKVNPKAVSIELVDKTITYGDTFQGETLTYETNINGDVLTYTTKLADDFDKTDAGTYEGVITATVVANPNYDVTFVDADLTIEPKKIASIVVAVDPAAVDVYSAAEDVKVTVTITDDKGNIVTDNALVNNNAVKFTDADDKTVADLAAALQTAGKYTIAPDVLTNPNYDLTNTVITPAELTVNKIKVNVAFTNVDVPTDTELPEIKPVVTDAEGKEITDADVLKNIGLTVTLKDAQGNAFVSTDEAGTYTISAEAANTNYDVTVTDATLTVIQYAAKIERDEGTEYYMTMAEAVADAKPMETIVALKDNQFAAAAMTLYVDPNGFTNVEAYAKAGYQCTMVDVDGKDYQFYFIQPAGTSSQLPLGGKYAYIDIDDNGSWDETVDSPLGYLQETLYSAASGQTVRIIKSLTGEDMVYEVIIPDGITLDIQSFSLEATYLVGLNGSYFGGDYITGEENGGRLIIEQNNFELANSPYRTPDANRFHVLPVYDTSLGCYRFGIFRVRTSDAVHGLKFNTTAEGVSNLHFGFVADTSKHVRTEMFAKDGITDNHLKIIVRLVWNTDEGRANQDFEYNEEFVKTIFNGGTHFALDIYGYEALGITQDNVEVYGMIISTSEAEAEGTHHNCICKK